MKKYILTHILLLVACAPLWAQASGQMVGKPQQSHADTLQVGIRFENLTLKQALAKADSLGYKVFVDCYTKTCGPCKMMAKHVFPMKECGDYFNSRFVSLMRDMEEGEGVDMAKKYGVRFYPTYLVLNPDGTLYCSWTGAVPMRRKETFVPLVKNRMELAGMTVQYRGGRRDTCFLDRYVPLLQKYDRPQLEKVIGETLLKQDVEAWLRPQNWAIVESEANRLGKALFRFLFDNREVFAQNKGRDKVSAMLLAVYATELGSYRGMGVDYSRCLPDLQQLSEEGVQGASALHYAARICEAVDRKQTERAEELVRMVTDIPARFESNTDRLQIIQLLKGLHSLLDATQKETVSQALNSLLPAFSPAQAKAAGRIISQFKQ